MLCLPAAKDAPRVCDAAQPVVGTTGGTIPVKLPDAGAATRLVMQYTGEDGGGFGTTVALRGKTRWFANDPAAPTVGAMLGSVPLAGATAINASAVLEGPLLLGVTAEDNVRLDGAGVGVTVGGKAVPLTAGEDGSTAPLQNGKREIKVSACDVAAPANCTVVAATPTIDTAFPQISALPAVVGSKDLRPEVRLKVVDPEVDGFASGIGAARLKLGDQVVDTESTPVQGGLRLRPKAPLPEAKYPLAVTVADGVGNVADTSVGEEPVLSSLVVDATPPSVAPSLPVPKTKLAVPPETLAAKVADNIGIETGRIEIDGVTIPSDLDTEGLLSATPATPVCAGTRKVRAVVTDFGGSTDTTRWSFVVKGKQTTACRRAACVRAKAAVVAAARAIAADKRGAKRARRSGSKSARKLWATRLRRDTRALRTARASRARTCTAPKPKRRR